MAEIYIKHSDLIKDPKQLKRALNDAIWVKGQSGRKKALKTLHNCNDFRNDERRACCRIFRKIN